MHLVWRSHQIRVLLKCTSKSESGNEFVEFVKQKALIYFAKFTDFELSVSNDLKLSKNG